jgi:hypothetical protein
MFVLGKIGTDVATPSNGAPCSNFSTLMGVLNELG